MKVVSEAYIEIVSEDELKIGDKILYTNHVCQVIKKSHRGVHFESLDNSEDVNTIKRFDTYYKVKNYAEKQVCSQCSIYSVEKAGQICIKCMNDIVGKWAKCPFCHTPFKQDPIGQFKPACSHFNRACKVKINWKGREKK